MKGPDQDRKGLKVSISLQYKMGTCPKVSIPKQKLVFPVLSFVFKTTTISSATQKLVVFHFCHKGLCGLISNEHTLRAKRNAKILRGFHRNHCGLWKAFINKQTFKS